MQLPRSDRHHLDFGSFFLVNYEISDLRSSNHYETEIHQPQAVKNGCLPSGAV